MLPDKPLKSLGEFGFIDHIRQTYGTQKADVIQGIGDDCAVLTYQEKGKLLWSMDTLLEGIHFRLDLIDFYLLGWKALAVNLSDIAAMGGIPTQALLSLGLQADIDVKALDLFFKGFSDLGQKHDVQLVGGDMVRSTSDIMITVSVLGLIKEGNHVLYRNKAQPGDWIVVTGPLGQAAAGLDILLTQAQEERSSIPQSIAGPLIQAHNQPCPAIEEGSFLASFPQVHAAIDLSDGLAQDLWQICRLSNVGGYIEKTRLPLSSEIKKLAKYRRIPAADWALFGGEDYHLLATIEAKAFEDIQARYSERFQRPLYPIGRITEEEGIFLITDSGERTPVKPAGYDHFQP